jgi:phosphate-selective porin OprO/OprP
VTHKKLQFLIALSLAGMVLPGAISAQADGPSFDDVWGLATWYDNAENPVIQKVVFTGRFQQDYARVSDDGNTHSEWNTRRMRLGFKTTWFQNVTLHVEADLNPQEHDPFYTKLTDAYIEWSRSDELAITVGKHSAPFTLDGTTSSKELLTIDRSNLANNMWFPSEYMPGVSASGASSGWTYHGGIYSAGASNREFGDFDGSIFVLAVLGYDLADEVGTDKALLRGSFVYQDPDPDNTFTRALETVASLNFDLKDGRFGLRADATTASGYLGQSDLWGTMLMPFFDVTDDLQLVGRHTYVTSSDPNGVRLARYESQLVDGRGDRYSEFYVGANYYVYGHKLKLQGGLAFGDMNDDADDGGAYSGVSTVIGLRLSW